MNEPNKEYEEVSIDLGSQSQEVIIKHFLEEECNLTKESLSFFVNDELCFKERLYSAIFNEAIIKILEKSINE